MKANFLVRWINGAPDLPPMLADSGLQLTYVEDGLPRGGFTCVSAPDKTVIVQVDASDVTIAAMKAAVKYIFLDGLDDKPAITLTTTQKTAIKDWLVNNGYDVTITDGLKLSTNLEAIKAIYGLLKLSDLQYKSGGLG